MIFVADKNKGQQVVFMKKVWVIFPAFQCTFLVHLGQLGNIRDFMIPSRKNIIWCRQKSVTQSLQVNGALGF